MIFNMLIITNQLYLVQRSMGLQWGCKRITMVLFHDYIIPSPVHMKFPAETVVDVGDDLHIFGTMRWCGGWFYA